MPTIEIQLKPGEVRQMRNGMDAPCSYAVRFSSGGEVRFTLPPGTQYELVGDGRPVEVSVSKAP